MSKDPTPPISIGLTLTCFARRDPVAEEGIVEVFEHYLKRWGKGLRTFIEDDTNKARSLTEKEVQYPRRRIAKAGSTSIFWKVSGAVSFKEANWWMFRAAIDRSPIPVDAKHLDGLQCAVHPGVPPVEWLSFVLDAASQMPVLHGSAGFGLVEPLNWRASLDVADVVTATASRYHGVDVLDIHAPCLEALDGIVAVNWLTIIHDELIAKLGGREPLRSQFTKDIICHDVRHGLVIQAGPKPVSGDVNGPDELGPYREVARVLRPIFTNGLPYDGEFRGLQALQQLTNPWRYRFFEGAKWPP